MDLNQLLKLTIERSASDLHIIANYFPTIRIHGELAPVAAAQILTTDSTEKILLPILSQQQKESFLLNRELDFGYELEGHRFRVNLYYSKGSISASFRYIPKEIKNFEELGLLPVFENFVGIRQGFILVTGPTGHGKSTTLASIINQINLRFRKHIVTIEDPIEYVYSPAQSIVSQREILKDSHSWSASLRAALREDPDVVLIGEMRDYETVQAALTIAETGHLVFSTVHTNSSAETINRIVDIFPSNQQNQVKVQLSATLAAVVSQRLVPNIEGNGRIPAFEILLNNSAVSTIIREGKTHLIDGVIETSGAEGMTLIEKHLYSLYIQKKITKQTASHFSIRPDQIKKMIGI